MQLHFIFVIKDSDLGKRDKEFSYVQEMGTFYKHWIKRNFLLDVDVKCDEMITKQRSILEKLDTSALLKDHRQRGEDIFHFYLTHFRPLWTDCTCEGYHAENFGMIWWNPLKENSGDLFLAEKNCTTVSHELAHELLRQEGYKKNVADIHDIWTKHLFSDLPFEQYGKDFQKTDGQPYFLAMDLSSLDR